jgi:enoyl-CoA hydratase/carnithine racemase
MRLFQLMESSPKTIVASINGACLAGGLCIVLSSDVSISSDAATFSAPEAKVGLADPFVPLRLARAIGTTRAKWMMLTADILDARAARNAGLITEVVPHEDLETATLSAVEKLQQTSPITRALYKKAANSDLAPFDRDLQFSANAGSDAREGLSAFVQKRKPQWPSRQ